VVRTQLLYRKTPDKKKKKWVCRKRREKSKAKKCRNQIK